MPRQSSQKVRARAAKEIVEDVTPATELMAQSALAQMGAALQAVDNATATRQPLTPELNKTPEKHIEVEASPLPLPSEPLPSEPLPLPSVATASQPLPSEVEEQTQDRYRFGSARDHALSCYDYANDGAMQIVQRAKKTVEDVRCSLQRRAQIFQPYYVKVHEGVTHIYGTIGDKAVMIRVRVDEFYGNAHAQAMKSITAVHAAVDRLTAPVVTRAVVLLDSASLRANHFVVSIKAGIVSIQGALGERALMVQAKLSEMLSPITTKLSDSLQKPRQALADFSARVVAVVSQAYGQLRGQMQLLNTKTQDGVLYITSRVNDQLLVVRIKVTDVLQLVQTQGKSLLTSTRAAITDSYGGARTKVVYAATAAKTKSLEVAISTRKIAGTQSAQVTAASAAGGAVALGATGGAAGFMTGGSVGAGCGILLAPFTLGLSIPIGAAVGAGTGLCLGAAAGGSAGLVSGGAAGYGVHKHKDEIASGVNGAISKAGEYKTLAVASTSSRVTSARSKIQDYKEMATASTASVRARLTGGTGETSPDSSSD